MLGNFINQSDSLSDLTIFILSLISSFEVISVVIREPKSGGREAKSEGQRPNLNIFLWIDISVSDAAAVNPNGINSF